MVQGWFDWHREALLCIEAFRDGFWIPQSSRGVGRGGGANFIHFLYEVLGYFFFFFFFLFR